MNNFFDNAGNDEDLLIDVRPMTNDIHVPAGYDPSGFDTFTYIYGKGEWYDSMEGKGRRRVGSTQRGVGTRDYTVFTVNWWGGSRLQAGSTYSHRGFLATGDLGDVEATAGALLDSTEAYEVDLEDWTPRAVDAYRNAGGTHFIVAAAAAAEGTGTACDGAAALVCHGKSTPAAGHVPFFYTTCANATYFGPDPYSLAPEFGARFPGHGPTWSDAVTSYLCRDEPRVPLDASWTHSNGKPEGTYFRFDLTDWANAFGAEVTYGAAVADVAQWRDGAMIWTGSVKTWTETSATAWPHGRTDPLIEGQFQTGDYLAPRPRPTWKLMGFFHPNCTSLETAVYDEDVFACQDGSDTPPTSLASSQPSTPPTSLASSQPSTPPTSTASSQPSTPPTSTASSQPSTPPTSTASDQPSTPPTSLASSPPSTPPTSTASDQPSTPPTSLASSPPSTPPTSTASEAPSSSVPDVPCVGDPSAYNFAAGECVAGGAVTEAQCEALATFLGFDYRGSKRFEGSEKMKQRKDFPGGCFVKWGKNKFFYNPHNTAGTLCRRKLPCVCSANDGAGNVLFE